jgi:hypothetical protein
MSLLVGGPICLFAAHDSLPAADPEFCMRDADDTADIELLARLAARLAGRDPDEHVTVSLAGSTAYEGPVWQYDDFLNRARAAYAVLAQPTAPPLA